MCRKLLGPEAPLSKKIWIESYPSKRNPLDRLGKKRTYSPTMDSHIQNFQKDYQLDFDRGATLTFPKTACR